MNMFIIPKVIVLCVTLVSAQNGPSASEKTKSQYDLSKTILPICSCAKNCATDNLTLPVIFPNELHDYSDVDIREFSLVQNIDLECDGDRVPVLIKPEDFFLIATGQLLHLTTNEAFETDQFCILPDFDPLEPVRWKVHLCLQPPRIPMCCSSDSGAACNVPKIPMWYGMSSIVEASVDISSSCAGKSVSPVQVYPGEMTYLMHESYGSILAMDLSNSTNFTTFFSYHMHDEFCLTENRTSESQFDVTYCLPDFESNYNELCQKGKCIHKCCPMGTVQNPTSTLCQETHSDQLWRPILTSHKDLETLVDFPPDLKINVNPLSCKRDQYMIRSSDPRNSFHLLDNGFLFTKTGKIHTPPSHYCVDNFVAEDGHVEEFALLCFPDDPPHLNACNRIKNYVIPGLLIVSCVFLAITLFVYAFIPELHAKLHGKSLLSHVAALLSAYFFLTMLRLASDQLTMSVCRSFALITQMSFLAAFFWLNVMCFDIWWTLRSMRPVTEANDSTRRRFAYYSVYAWGFPILIGVATMAMEFLPAETTSRFVLPGFGVSSCWFQSDVAKWIYLYSFILGLTMTNIFFFICVTVILIQAQRANDSILRTPNLHHQERVWIYLKLFVVMGVTWVCEVISFQQKSCEYWFITDVINALQGLFIFLIFICKKSVFHKLPFKKRAPKGLKKRPGTSQGTSSYGSSSLSTQQSSLESSTRKLSSSLSYHFSKLHRDHGQK